MTDNNRDNIDTTLNDTVTIGDAALENSRDYGDYGDTPLN